MARKPKSSASAEATSKEIVGLKPHTIPAASAVATAKALAKVRGQTVEPVPATPPQTENQPAGDAGKGE